MPPTEKQLQEFSAYDFDSDSKWKEYYLNLTIPPGKDEQTVMRRYKQKYYKKCIDPEFEVQPLASSNSSAMPSSGTATRQQTDSRETRPSPQRRRASSVKDQEIALFVINAVTIFAAVVALFPITPLWIAVRSFRLATFGFLFSSGAKILLNYGGFPSLTLAGLKQKFEAAAGGPEFPSVYFALIFAFYTPTTIHWLISSHAIFSLVRMFKVLPVLPMVIHTLPSFADFLLENIPQRWAYFRTHLQEHVRAISRHRNELFSMAASLEIALGFFFIFSLLMPKRNVFLVLMYWQMLKAKVHFPASMWFHRQVWSTYGAPVEAFLARYFPAALTVLQYGKRWFLQR